MNKRNIKNFQWTASLREDGHVIRRRLPKSLESLMVFALQRTSALFVSVDFTVFFGSRRNIAINVIMTILLEFFDELFGDGLKLNI
jgi:hypothetical protein